MKRNKRFLFVCIAACSLLFSGCGETLHELTVEEEDLIVHYAAYAVAKHNIQQKDGMSGVAIPDAEAEDTESVADTEMQEGTQTPDGGNSGEGSVPAVDDSTVTLANAIGHGNDLIVTYTGAYVTDNYIEGSAYSIDAADGKTFYIMKFLLTNITQEDVAVENLTKGFSFKLVSGDFSVNSEVTFLMSDFSTYVGTIGAGQSVETVLLFEVPESNAESMPEEPNLQITIDNSIKNVKL